MTGVVTRARFVVGEDSTPVLAPFARLQDDKARGRRVILAPERVLVPDEIAVEVLILCDGVRTVGAIADDLAARFTADRAVILVDVLAMLQDLADQTWLVERPKG